MRVISNKTLQSFSAKHPLAALPLQAWRAIIESRDYLSFSELRQTFNTVDVVGEFCVFNIGGNKYRLIAAIHFNRQLLFIRHVLTHKEYDTWKP